MSQNIIVDPKEEVACPHCEKQFELREALTNQLIESYETAYETMIEKERTELELRLTKDIERKTTRQHDSQLEELKDKLSDSKEAEKKAKQKLDTATKKAAAEAKSEAVEENKALQEEIDQNEKKLAEYREEQLQLRKDKKALEAQKVEMDLEIERRLDTERKTMESSLSNTWTLKEAEYKKKITDAQKSNEELTRKLEQGSQQLQGEVLELEIEEMLEQAYPFDEVEPVGKGVRGADIIQTVKMRSGTVCGRIIWETKRAENWSNKWIPKLKDDQVVAGGDIAVLVTTVFPADVTETMLVKDGVWLVKPELVKGLSEALRTVLIESQRQKSISAGKGEQVEALFDYICSNQFAQRIISIVEGYDEMRVDLDKEKKAIQRMWKKREGQIDRVSTQVVNICGELQGISAASLPHLDEIGSLEGLEAN